MSTRTTHPCGGGHDPPLGLRGSARHPGALITKTAGGGAQLALEISALEITVRNDICDMTGGFAAAGETGFSVAMRGIEASPTGVRIYNNTAYSADSTDFTVVSLASTATNATVRNNLGSAPNASSRTMINGAPSGLVQSTNLLNNSPATLFVTGAPANPADFSLKAGSPAVNAGSVAPVFEYARTATSVT